MTQKLERFSVDICKCEFGPHLHAEPGKDGVWVNFDVLAEQISRIADRLAGDRDYLRGEAVEDLRALIGHGCSPD